jgi:hypothetical protein
VRKYQSGFGALEVLICLIIASLAIVSGAKIYGNYLDRQENRQAGEQLIFVADAAAKYIKDNYAAVLAVATASAPAVITPLMLRNTGYLPAGFSDANSYGQTYQVLALEPTANKLETLIVTTGGESIKELYLLEISKLVGARGGYISSTDTTLATGSFGGWSTPLAPYGVSPGAGHLAAGLFFDDGALVTDYLYRNSVPGQPEVNRMNTAIDMATNDLNNTGTVNATTAAISGDTTTAGETYTGGWFRAKGDGGLYNEKHNGGWYMSDPGWLRSYADKGVYTGGEMRAGKITSEGRTEVGEYLQLNGMASVGGVCTPNGLLARSGAGKTLSCQSGVWSDVGLRRTMTLHPAGGGLTAAVTGQTYMRNLGWHTECSLTRTGDSQGSPPTRFLGEVYPFNGPDSSGRYEWLISLISPAGSSISAACYTDS